MMSTSDDSGTQEQEEQVEGLGDHGDLQTTDYPLDDIMVRSETRAVSEVVKRIQRNRFFMAPDFQLHGSRLSARVRVGARAPSPVRRGGR